MALSLDADNSIYAGLQDKGLLAVIKRTIYGNHVTKIVTFGWRQASHRVVFCGITSPRCFTINVGKLARNTVERPIKDFFGCVDNDPDGCMCNSWHAIRSV